MDERNLRTLFFVIGAALLLLAIAVLFAYFKTMSGPIAKSANDWAAFGSLVGGLAGSAIAASALMALIYGLVIQHQEFGAIRSQMESQAFYSKLASAKSTYVNLVTLLEKSYRDGGAEKKVTGHELLRLISTKIQTDLRRRNMALPQEQKELGLSVDKARDVYLNIINKNKYGIGHYIRIVYHIFKYLDTQYKIKNESAEEEIRLFQAQLSSSEVTILTLNALTKDGAKFKELISKWGLLEHLPSEAREKIGRLALESFGNQAFGDRPL